MKILAIEKISENSDWENSEPLLKIEAEQVWKLYKSGIIREIYFTTTDNRAILILETKDEIEVQTILNELPLVKSNLIHFEILPLKNYDGFERLFVK